MQASGVPLCPQARDYLSRVNLWSVGLTWCSMHRRRPTRVRFKILR